MDKSEDISKLDRAIKDAEIRIKTILVNIDAIAKEIDLLSNQEKTLEDNIRCLKKSRIIAIAQEFKKSKVELQRIKTKTLSLRNEKEHFTKTTNDMENFIKENKKRLDKLQSNNENNVLQFNRGNKDGQG